LRYVPIVTFRQLATSEPQRRGRKERRERWRAARRRFAAVAGSRTIRNTTHCSFWRSSSTSAITRLRLLLDEFLDDAAELRQVHVSGFGGRHAVRSCSPGAGQSADGSAVEISQDATRPDALILCDVESRNPADTRPLRQELAVCIEDFDPLVVAIGDVHLSLRVDHHVVRQPELSRSLSPRPPFQDELSIP